MSIPAMTRIERALFRGNTVHDVIAFELAGDAMTLLLQPRERPESGTRAMFSRVNILSVDDSYADEDAGLPWDIIGFDGEPLLGNRWRFCLHTDAIEYVFEADWPVIRRVGATDCTMNVTIVDGDLLDQDVDVIVNAWNRNIIPWWLLLPQGVSGAIKKRGGLQPFRELGRMGAIPLGHAVETSAGKLPFQAIIHVAGINMLWRSSESSIRDSVRSAIALASERGYRSIAIPLIGAGSGGGKPDRVQSFIEDELARCHFDGEVRIVRYRK